MISQPRKIDNGKLETNYILIITNIDHNSGHKHYSNEFSVEDFQTETCSKYACSYKPIHIGELEGASKDQSNSSKKKHLIGGRLDKQEGPFKLKGV